MRASVVFGPGEQLGAAGAGGAGLFGAVDVEDPEGAPHLVGADDLDGCFGAAEAGPLGGWQAPGSLRAVAQRPPGVGGLGEGVGLVVEAAGQA